jgi:hypothetical protein
MTEEISKDQKRFLSYVQKDDGPNPCWRWCGSKAITGYGNFYYKGCVFLAHRASLLIFGRVKSLTPGLQVAHACRTRDCTNPDHLSEKTKSENNGIDKKTHGVDCSGEKSHFSKLNWEKVAEIRSAQDKKPKELAETYGVSQSCISSILRGKTWKE